MTVDRPTMTRVLDEHDTQRTACPPAETLVRATSPETDRRLREEVADHLIGCGRCADEFRVAQAMAAWVDAMTGGEDGPRRGHDPQPDPHPSHPVATPDRPRRRAAGRGSVARDRSAVREWWDARDRASPWTHASAALAIISIGLGLLLVRMPSSRADSQSPADAQHLADSQQLADARHALADLQHRLDSAESPQLNAPIIELMPIDATRTAGASTGPRTKIPANARQVVLVLNTSNPKPGTPHDIDIIGDDARVLWRGVGLTETAHGTLALVLPATLLAPRASIRLYDAAHHTLLEQYLAPTMTTR